jgi:G3E family GTPase
MTKIDIYSGFLGAGKTTLIKKMIQEAHKGENLVLIENEFGEIGIDGGFLQDAGVNITEMNSGCICCSLVGDFGKALTQVIQQYHPDRILIEPSGVGKLSDVVAAVEKVTGHDVVLGAKVAVADANKVKIYMKNFGEFYNNQIETASTIILSRTDSIPQAKLDAAVALLREHNADATLVVAPWNELTGHQLLEAMEGEHTLQKELEELEHHHHHHEHEEGCCCGHHDHEHHHHEHEEGCCCGHHDHEHHHHDHEEGCCCGHHDHEHHHHDHEEGCSCGCGHDHDHHHHHADEVFTSWGVETAHKFTVGSIQAALSSLDTGRFGMVLRAKGIVACADGGWIHFDYVPGEENVRMGAASVIGKLCVIGAQIDEKALAALFGV